MTANSITIFRQPRQQYIEDCYKDIIIPDDVDKLYSAKKFSRYMYRQYYV